MNGTQLINVRVKYLRPRHHDLREWMQDPANVYIGRGGSVFVTASDGSKTRWPPAKSKWCNNNTTGTLPERIAAFERDLDTLLLDEHNAAEFRLLRGKTLGCWCKPAGCHGDVILARLDALP